MGNKIAKLPSKIDLVTTAQAEYEFLRMVDEHPALSSEPVIRNAIYRYEQYWLPLVAEYEEIFLPAPLDIEWVWHCHILNPSQYRIDCTKIVNKVVDHRPYKLCEHNISLSKRYWKDKYKNVPFDIDLKNVTPIMIESYYAQQSIYDIASATLRQRLFNYSSSLPHYRDKKFLKKAVRRYYIMLKIKKSHPSTFIVPCYDNDLIWHTHQQHPLAYQQDTLSILGKMLNHNDTTTDRSPGSHLANSSAETRELWRKKSKAFSVPGTLYRGEPPMPRPEEDLYWCRSPAREVSSVKTLHNIFAEMHFSFLIINHCKIILILHVLKEFQCTPLEQPGISGSGV